MASNISYRRATFKEIYIWTAPDGVKKYWVCFRTEQGIELNIELSDVDAMRAQLALNQALTKAGGLVKTAIAPGPERGPRIDTSTSQVDPLADLYKPASQAIYEQQEQFEEPGRKTPGQMADSYLKSGNVTGKPADATFNGMLCALCGERQWASPAGVTCKNGHGGADGKRDIPRKKLTVVLDEPEPAKERKRRADRLGNLGLGPDGVPLL